MKYRVLFIHQRKMQEIEEVFIYWSKLWNFNHSLDICIIVFLLAFPRVGAEM